MMAQFTFEPPDGFLKQLGRLADVDRVAPKMIDEAMPILEKNTIAEVTKHRDTGDMVNSIKKTKAGINSKGNYFAVVRPTGKDRKGVRNMEKLAHLEYGTSKRKATPMLTTAIENSKTPVLNKMREVFEREMK